MSAVLLDAMGTLVELQRPAPLLVDALAARGVTVGEADADRALRAEIAFYRAHHDEAADDRCLEDLRDRCAGVLRDALPPSARALPHAELRAAMLAALRFRAFADVAPALARLRAAGHALVVVSNWDVSLHAALERTGLRSLVDGAVSSAEAGASKPDPAIFARALGLAGARADEAVHVGDSLDHDVAGALAAGLRAVLVARGGAPGAVPPGVRVIASLAELGQRAP